MEHTLRRRPVTLTVPEDVLQAAKALSLNTSQAAEAGIRQAVREAQSKHWLAENQCAVDAYNLEVAQRGVAIPPPWESR